MANESGYNSELPTGIGLFGILRKGFTITDASTGTDIGATQGGLKFDPGITLRNVPYDGQMAPTKGLDRVTMRKPQISGTFIQANSDNLGEVFEPGGATPTTLQSQGAFFASGDYITNLAILFKRSDGSYFGWNFPNAIVVQYDVAGQSADGELQINATFEARLAQGATPDESQVPVERFEIAAA